MHLCFAPKFVQWKFFFFFLCSLSRTPFDQNTFGGFAGILASELIGGSMFLTITFMISSLCLSMGLYFGAFCGHFELMFRNMSEIKIKNEPKYMNRLLLKTRLIEAVNFHNHAKR